MNKTKLDYELVFSSKTTINWHILSTRLNFRHHHHQAHQQHRSTIRKVQVTCYVCTFWVNVWMRLQLLLFSFLLFPFLVSCFLLLSSVWCISSSSRSRSRRIVGVHFCSFTKKIQCVCLMQNLIRYDVGAKCSVMKNESYSNALVCMCLQSNEFVRVRIRIRIRFPSTRWKMRNRSKKICDNQE